jgi:type II secretion system protein J
MNVSLANNYCRNRRKEILTKLSFERSEGKKSESPHVDSYRKRAFTLIEVMIAMAVFAIVLAAINGIFWGALRLRKKTVESIDAALPTEQTLAIIRNDLANIVPPEGGVFLTTFQTTVANTNSATSGMLPTISQQGLSSPQFTTSNGRVDDSTMWSDIQKISYTLANSTNRGTGRDLVRNVTRNLLPVIQQDLDQQTILTGVKGIYFFYHDGTQWKEAWDTNEVYKLPRAIKVQIAMDSDERGRVAPPPLEVVVPMIDAGTNTLASATTTP